MSVTDWPDVAELEANQRGLHEEFERLAASLAGGARMSERERPSAPTSLDRVGEAFGLTPFERGLLGLCAGVELHTGLAQAVAASTGEVSWSLAHELLPDPHWSAITPAATLRRWQLLQVGPGPVAHAPLRICERVLHYLVGVDDVDVLLAPVVTRLRAPELLPAPHADLAVQIARSWADPSSPWGAAALHGDDRDGRLDVSWAACAALGLEPFLVRAHDLPVLPGERDLLATVWTRDSLLSGLALVIDVEEGGPEAPLAGWLERVDGPVVVCSRAPVGLPGVVRLEVSRPDAPEQRRLWRTALAEHHEGREWEDAADLMSSTHRLSAREIVECSRLTADATDPADLGRAVRGQLQHAELGGLVRPIRPRARWSDLVLPGDRLELLHALADQVLAKRIVHDDWGFADTSARGLAVTALFAGESGTGKTMAAEVIAHELGLDLLHVDLSAVVSKYIGETEKNLRLVFDGADATGAILLFDEADALFGKRSEVRDSHDRYANIEVSYLLQRMETYRGLAVLTTNARANLDPAFVRRLGFIVQFPFPDAEHRARIWQGAFPDKTPTQGLDPRALSRLAISGGAIRNIAVAAAFRAAAADRPVGMAEVAWAARAELAKAERTVSPSDLAGWDA
ncbi:ATP-binding protein [Nocardioides sp. cx-173]|uniref:ATP-binding protein n=1 Tax=Nocardioides sp. cx-173 TaxID=2898796 RepID=UPI001E6058D8|nr:ATP-binding protein [Nocardioides sp. cx-173]MCD4525964.1 ATP-binding protein [Nocardioides sp. cx-173]UGB43661.1 ATP-binding protein [Nocardioides sp. cx-173]